MGFVGPLFIAAASNVAYIVAQCMFYCLHLLLAAAMNSGPTGLFEFIFDSASAIQFPYAAVFGVFHLKSGGV